MGSLTIIQNIHCLRRYSLLIRGDYLEWLRKQGCGEDTVAAVGNCGLDGKMLMEVTDNDIREEFATSITFVEPN